MAESYSVEAVLTAKDKNFSKTMKGAIGSVDRMNSGILSSISGLGSKISSGLGTAVKVGITTALSGAAATAAAGGAMLVKSMNLAGDLEQNLGGSEAVFEQYASGLQKTAKDAYKNMGLSTSDYLATANKMGSLFQGAGFDVKQSMDLSSSAMQRASDVASIMGIRQEDAMEAVAGAAKGNFTMMDNLGVAMNDTAIGAYAVSKGINKSTQEMTSQEKIGLAMQMFMEKTSKYAGNYAKENDTLAGSLGTAKAALSNFMATGENIDDVISSGMQFAKVAGKMAKELGPKLLKGLMSAVKELAPKIPGIMDSIGSSVAQAIDDTFGTHLKGAWAGFSKSFGEVAGAIGEAISAIAGELGKVNGATNGASGLETLGGYVNTAKDALMGLADFAKDHAAEIATLIKNLPKIVVAVKGFQILSKVAPFVTSFARGMGQLASQGLSALVGKLTGVAVGQTAVGTSAAASVPSILASAAAFIALGIGVALIAFSFTSLINAAIALAAAGPMAIGVFVGLIAVIALLVIGLALLGPILTAGAVGFIAFGAAILLAGVGVLSFGAGLALAGVGLTLLASTLPTVAQYGLQAAIGFVALGVSLLVVGAGALVAGVGILALSVGVIALTVGVLALGVAMLVLGAGLLIVAAALLLVGVGLTLISATVMVAVAGTMALSAGMVLLGASSLIVGAALLVIGAGMLVLSAGALVATVAVVAFGIAMAAAALGTAAMALALKAVNSSMKSIASNASSASSSIKSMKSGISIVNEGLDALKSKASNAIKGLISAFKSGETSATSSARNLANNSKSAIQSGLSQLGSIAMNAMNAFNVGFMAGAAMAQNTASSLVSNIKSIMSSASSGMNSIGYYIGAGLASGMASSLGEVRAIASKLAEEAEKAVRAKADIHSPSRVFKSLGAYMGEGLKLGIESMKNSVAKASDKLIDISTPTPDGFDNNALAYSSSSNSQLEGNYDYSSKIEVSSGKQPAYITLKLGSQEYKAFVDDISGVQGLQSVMMNKF